MSKTAAYIGLGLIALFLVLICVSLAHASYADTTSRHKNSIGAVIYQDNPNFYLAGNVISGAVIESGDKKYLNIRVQPSHTFTLFTEDVLFCDAQNVLDKFVGKENPVVLIYERIAHESVQSIGCHNLLGVSEVKSENEVK
jgi:hypothetical protein